MDKLLQINMLTQNSAHNVKNPILPNCAQGDNLPLIKEFVFFFKSFLKGKLLLKVKTCLDNHINIFKQLQFAK